VGLIVIVLTMMALWGIEKSRGVAANPSIPAHGASVPFKTTLMEVWAEPKARRMTIFIFTSMLAYSAQELVFEPFAGAVLSLTPGESTQLTGLQHSGALMGMILVALIGARLGTMQSWIAGGCIASSLGLCALALAGILGPVVPIQPVVFVLGFANGTFAVSAIGAMMRLAGAQPGREGVRMGLWGAAQAIAFALGGLFGTGASDVARQVLGAPDLAYASVFLAQAALFLIAAFQARQLEQPSAAPRQAWQFGPLNPPAKPNRGEV
jgi:BCD family chlorophyll transporter-like MFS transporter